MFEEFGNYKVIDELYKTNCFDIPDKKGLYIIKKPNSMNIIFSSDTKAIKEYKGRSMLYKREKLIQKYEKSNKEVLYIGKADGDENRLFERIGQLVNYGYGLVNNHRGGRAVWQIENNKSLLLGYLECDNPSTKEKELLNRYKKEYGVLPVANWRIG